MMIWLLALVLLASLAGLGYRQGVIRVAFSLVGIVVAALAAFPLGPHLAPALKPFGVKHPYLAAVIGTGLVFIIVLAIVKGVGFAVHHKVDVYFRYKAGDLRLALWERLSRRLGLCLGLANALAYLTLLSWVIYTFGYYSTQLFPQEEKPWYVNIWNRTAGDLCQSGFVQTAWGVKHLPETYYDVADLLGLIYQNPLIEARLARYPALTPLSQDPDFAALGTDQQLGEQRLKQAPIGELFNQPVVQRIYNDPAKLDALWQVVGPNRADFKNYLLTGKSEQYDGEPILGRWRFNLGGAIAAYKRSKPDVLPSEMKKLRERIFPLFERISMLAAPEPGRQVWLSGLREDWKARMVMAIAAAPKVVAGAVVAGQPAPTPTVGDAAAMRRYGLVGRGGPDRGRGAPPAAYTPPAYTPPAGAPADDSGTPADYKDSDGTWTKSGNNYKLTFKGDLAFDATLQNGKLLIALPKLTGFSEVMLVLEHAD